MADSLDFAKPRTSDTAKKTRKSDTEKSKPKTSLLEFAEGIKRDVDNKSPLGIETSEGNSSNNSPTVTGKKNASPTTSPRGSTRPRLERAGSSFLKVVKDFFVAPPLKKMDAEFHNYPEHKEPHSNRSSDLGLKKNESSEIKMTKIGSSFTGSTVLSRNASLSGGSGVIGTKEKLSNGSGVLLGAVGESDEEGEFSYGTTRNGSVTKLSNLSLANIKLAAPAPSLRNTIEQGVDVRNVNQVYVKNESVRAKAYVPKILQALSDEED